MFESAAPRSAERSQPNLGDILEDALHQAKSLVQAELSLARRELVGELSSAASALALLSAGAILLTAGLATLGALLVLAFGVGIAAAAVVVAFLAPGTVLVVVAVRSLERKRFPRTTARLALDAKQVMETVK
jgi:Flp pilus assembly protein TadB